MGLLPSWLEIFVSIRLMINSATHSAVALQTAQIQSAPP
jgi:hypothetical protein